MKEICLKVATEKEKNISVVTIFMSVAVKQVRQCEKSLLILIKFFLIKENQGRGKKSSILVCHYIITSF